MTSRLRRLGAAASRYLRGQTPRQQRARWQERTAGRDLPPDHFETVLYFAGTAEELPRLRQWFRPLAELHTRSACVVVCREPDVALTLLDECPVPVVQASWVDDIERFAATQRLRLALYVDQDTRNLQMMRLNGVLHVFTGFDRCDDLLSGQTRCYDYAFVASASDADLMRTALINYDVDDRVRQVGPQRAGDSGGQPAGLSLPDWLDACAAMVDECDALLAARRARTGTGLPDRRT